MASSANPNYYCDVFINHRGPDSKKTFASHLYRRILLSGFRVFLDNLVLQNGNDFSSQIENAIRNATVHIAIFSPRYADSVWCLNELLLMLESQAPIIPVYYHVRPWDLRRGIYDESLLMLQKKIRVDPSSGEMKARYDRTTIENWRNALARVSDMYGLELDACDGDEGELVDRILQIVEKRARKPPLDVAMYPTGLDAKVEEFEKSVLCNQEQQIGEAMFAGIVGIGGVGKTTLAKEFFNRKRSYYSRSCFLFGVREIAAKSSLRFLQSKLLKDLTSYNQTIDSTDEGITVLKRHLEGSKSLIVLDDVDDVEQLYALVSPIKAVLDPTSFLLVTSRNKDVLRRSGMGEASIYKLTSLDEQHSQELFCSHAFKQPYPLFGFERKVREFLDVCDGLPLCLKVFGALLQGRTDVEYWKVVLDRTSRVLPADIQSSLKISYDSLDEEEKEIFLDIACFFIGEDRDKAIIIWNGSGWEAAECLRSLETKCLVEIDSKNRIIMHDHFRELGRDLADKGYEGRPRRLWRPVDNLDLQNVFRHEASVRGISKVQRRSDQSLEDLGELNNLFMNFTISNRSINRLQLLRAEGDCLESVSTVLRHLDLLWLCWNNYPYTSLPVWIPTKHLRVLEMDGVELETLWESESEVHRRFPFPVLLLTMFPSCYIIILFRTGLQAPLQLRELNVGASLVRVPKSIGKLKYLEKIEMKDTIEPLPEEFFHLRSLKHLTLRTRMMAFPDSLWKLTNLQHLDLSGSKDLQTLPPSLGDLRNLKHVSFNGCCSLQLLPDSFGNLILLKHLSLAGCSNLKISDNTFGNIKKLESLDLSSCLRLEALPPQVTLQWSLEKLILSSTNLKELPSDIGMLSNLEILKLQSPFLERLPLSLGGLARLKELTLYFCDKLEDLPDSVGELKQLRVLTIQYAKIEHLPEGLTELNNLEILKVISCPLREMPFGSVANIRGGKDLRGLKHLDLQGTSIQELSFPRGCCPNLQHLNISYCHELVQVGALPMELMSLELQECPVLDEVGGLSGLAKLRRLDISRCGKIKELPGLETLISLEELQAYGCQELKSSGSIHKNRKYKSVQSISKETGVKKIKL